MILASLWSPGLAVGASAATTTFTVVYNANGGAGTMANTVVTYGVATPLQTNVFTHAAPNTLFAGWYAYRASDKAWYYWNGTTKAWYTEGAQPAGYVKCIYTDGTPVSATSSVNGDTVTMYAQWAPGKFTVVYNANTGTGSMASTTVFNGVSTPLRPNAFTHAAPNSWFIGWYANRASDHKWYYWNGTTKAWYTEGAQPAGYVKCIYTDSTAVAATTSVNGDTVTMYAQWGSGALPTGGMSRVQADDFIAQYKALNDYYAYIKPGQFGDSAHYQIYHAGCSAGALANCVALSQYFVNRYTTKTWLNTVDGNRVAQALIDLGFADGGHTPKPYAIFSYTASSPGHTGVVLSVDQANNVVYTAEAKCGQSIDSIDVYSHSLSEMQGANYRYAYPNAYLKPGA